MAIIIGGHEAGLLDSSLALLNRNDRSRGSDPGHGEQLYTNVSNGNLVIQQRDIFLPSFGDDFTLIRTYNSRGTISDALFNGSITAEEHQKDDPAWRFSTGIFLEWIRPEEDENPSIDENYFFITYGDGTKKEFIYDTDRGLWVSTDGAGAYETLSLTRGSLVSDDDDWDDNRIWYTVTRADQTQYSFDAVGRLRESVDTNGVAMTYQYGGNKLLSKVLDDDGHVLRFFYDSDRLSKVKDENNTTLVEYTYNNENIVKVKDRFGHETRYFYDNNDLITKIRLPERQSVDGQTQTFERREIEFEYQRLEWDSGSEDDIDDTDSKAWVVREIIDAEGGVTTFEYDFNFQDDPSASHRFFGHYDRAEKEEYPGTGAPEDSVDPYSHFTGGSTRMVDALGNSRAYSNDAEYQQWRSANGYYQTYSSSSENNPDFQAQVDAIRNAHSLTYSYRADGYLTEVIDQQAYKTTYEYDADDNLTAITDRNGYAVTNSDSAYYREVRQALGIVDAANNGKLVADLTAAEIGLLIEAFTSHFSYDDEGNLLSSTDNADNLTTFTYTDFNKLASSTTAVGHALVNSDEPLYQDQRVELGYAPLVTDLSTADKQALLDLHTTFLEYDAQQNLVERRDPGGDITRFSYDSFGNQIQRTVFLDANDQNNPHQKQVTTFAYDGFGNNISSTDAEGNQTFSEFDHFGNLTQFIDGNGGVTSFTYDADNRLLTATDPEGHVTVNTYDAVGNRISVTDADGHTVTRIYDRTNNLLATVDPSATDPLQDRMSGFEFDVIGNRTATVDAEGRRTEFVFNARRELVEVITAEVGDENNQPTMYRSSLAYDGEGNRIRTTNNRGFITDIFYTQNNLIREQTDPNGHITRFEYDANNNRVQITAGVQLAAPKRQILQFSFDEENQLVSQTDAEGNLSRFGYDSVGNSIAVIDANGNATEFEYDRNNRLIREIRPAVIDPNTGLSTRYTAEHIFDANGNEIETIDENGNRGKFTFDKDNKLVIAEDANGIKTVFQYDSRENRTAVIIGADVTTEQVELNDVLSYDDFENGLGNYVDGGRDMRLYTEGSRAHQGNNAANIQDNSGEASSFSHAGTYDITQYSTLEVDFWFYANSMEPNEDFWVQLWDGNQWQTVATFVSGVDFENNEFKHAVVTISRDDYNFSNEARIRFRADASSNGDDVYIDEIEVRALGTAQRLKINIDDAQATRFIYDEFNQVIAQIDGLGNALAESDGLLYQRLRTELGYAALVAELSAADQSALRDLYTRHFSYDKVGNQISTTDNLDRITQFEYDALNRQVGSTDALGEVTRFRFDGNSNRVAQVDALGRETLFAYDSVDRLTDTTDPLGVVSRREYDDFGNQLSNTRAFGTLDARTNNFEYDLNNRVVAQFDPEGHRQSFEYDAVGNRLRVTDGRGNDSQFVYDALNRNVKIIDPLSFETRFEYDGVGNRLALIDARGGVTRFVYDPGNRLIESTDAEGRVTRVTFDLRGNRIEQRTAVGTADEQTTVFEYDAEDNLRQVIDAEGNTTHDKYDRVYNRIDTIDGNGNATQTEFDALDRAIRVIDAEGGITEFTYDAVSNQLNQTDQLGRVTSFDYDANNRLITQTTADGVETRFAHDRIGNRTIVTRAANTTDVASDTFVYDLNDRLVEQRDAVGNITRFDYDENGNNTVVIDANGYATLYTFDANNQVTQINDPEGNQVHFEYDGNGNRTRITDARGNHTISYFNANNEVSLSVDAEDYATSFEYDNNGNIVSQTLHMQALTLPLDPALQPVPPSGVNDQTTQFEYDQLNRVTARTDGEGFRTEFVYDAVGNRLTVRQFRDLAGTDVAVTRSYYDDLNREILRVSAEGYLSRSTYDAVGNRTSLTRFDERVSNPAGGVPAPQPGDTGRTEQFVYDLVNRQVRATSALGVLTDFEYDARGNRTATVEAVGTADQRRSTFRYDTVDRLVESRDALGTRSRLILDGNGNVVQRQDAAGTLERRVTNFIYDGNNRMVQQNDALNVITQWVYDGNGNIVSRTLAVGLPEARTETNEYDRNNRMIAVINGEGERSEFAYDGAGNRTKLLEAPGLAEARIRIYEYDRDNRQIAQFDGEGIQTEFRYDGVDNLIEKIEAFGIAGEERHFFNSYDLDNRLLQSVDPLGFTTQFEYDVLGNQIRIVDANGGVQLNTFDIIGRLISSVSAGGTLTQSSYDLRNNLVSVETSFTDGFDSRVSSFEYDLLDREVRSTNGNGYSTDTNYDVFGNQIQVTRGLYLVDSTAPEYDPIKAALAFPQTTLSQYDALDRLVSLTDARGTETTFTYNAVGNQIRVIDGTNLNNDRMTTFSYDLANRLIETVNPEGGTRRNTYNALGQVIQRAVLQSEDGAGNQIWINTYFEYDDNGRLTARVDGEGVRFEFEYDAVGNQILVRFAAGSGDERVKQTEYDLDNQVVAEIDGEGNRSEFAYDAIGNQIRFTDARGGTTRFYFNADNRLISTLNAQGYITESDYDSVGNLVTSREFFGVFSGVAEEFDAPLPPSTAADRVTQFRYDGNAQPVARIEADGAAYFFTYDGIGNLASEIDALGRETTYVYNLNNQLVILKDASGVETHYAYDLVDNRVSIVRAANTADATAESFSYDLNNRLVQEVDGLGNARSTFTYDKADNQLSESDANGNNLSFAYDSNNRLIDFADGEGHVTRYVYDAVGNRIQEIDPRNNVEFSFYNDNNQVTHLIDREGFVTTFDYDANGNIVGQTLHMQALSLPVDPQLLPTPIISPDDQLTLFEYDALNRVTARVDAEGFRTEFVYDAAGNQLQLSQYRNLAGSDIATTHSYFDAMNREIARVSAQGYLTLFEYDAEGNRIGRTQFDELVTVPASGIPMPIVGDIGRNESFNYDALDRLIRSTSALGVDTVFEYDDRGNRTAAVEAVGTSDHRRTEFIYDAADRLTHTIDALGVVIHLTLDANGNVVEQRDAFGTVAERLTTFSYDGNNRNINRTDAIGVITTMDYDGNGNVTGLTTAVGLPETRTETFEYDRNNRRIAEVNGEGERTESSYDGAGNRTRLMLAPGLAEERVNSFEFDRDNRLVAGVDGEGVRTEYRYDGAGNKIETIQAVGQAGQQRLSQYVYDLDNRLLQVTDPLGFVTQYEYDVLGNQVITVNANGNTQQSTFDALGRLVSSLSAVGTLTSNAYDLRGNIVGTTQAFANGSDSRTTHYGYDLLDRQILVTDPEGFSTGIAYDAFGNQTTVTHGQYLLNPGDAGYDAAKAARAFAQTNVFAYDAADRLLSLRDGEGNITTYGYDAVGNRINITEAANSAPRTTTFSYDLVNRIIETVNPEGGISRNSYDATGNRIAEAILQSDAGAPVWINRGFEYDGNARLTAEIDGLGVRTEREYDAMGNETLVRAAAGTGDERVTRKEYDLNNRVSAEIDGENNRSEFVYDSIGNRIRVIDALGRVARFYYDGANRLVAVLDAESYINEFVYDAVGNRSEERVYFSRFSGTVDDFVAPIASPSARDRISISVYDGNNRALTRIEADGSRSEFDYDAAGNLRREVQFANTGTPRELVYSYDLNNRLIEFTDVDGTVTVFSYDGANNRLSETLTNTSDPNAVRQTVFGYDLNNRQISETFDPGGLNFVQTTAYDKIGNVIAQTDANGHTTTIEYDLNNRAVAQTDALGNRNGIVYDAVGNQLSVTDARGFTTDFNYDNNNRLAREVLPSVQIYTVDGGLQTARPVIQHVYDAAGNQIQTIDAAGFITTRYFNSNDQQIAAISGDNVLREFTYAATGELLAETLYMTRLSAGAHDPAVLPAPPAGEARTTTREYDLAGRITRTVHPSIEVTTLSNSGSDNPVETRISTQPEERIEYDAFGNAVESIDKNGNRILAYFDNKDRQVAVIDGAGYLTEFDYDSQDNVVEQRIYAVALDSATIDPSTRPAAPAGEVYVVSRSYDAANRLVEERSPAVDVFNPDTNTVGSERVLTLFSFDAVGNQLSRTIAAGTVQALTEYSYYDALNRQVATIDGNRVVNFFQYDASSNQTSAKRFFNAVASGVDLSGLSGSTDFGAQVANDTNDQALQRVYDALNRLRSETELMGTGAGDDLNQSFRYDAGGERTWARDEDGFVQEFTYNAAGRIVKSISPDGSGSVAEFDAAGNQIFLFTGQIDSQAQPATNLSATIADDLTIDWQLPPGSRVESYVVYDSVSRILPGDYANQGAVQATWFGTSGASRIATDTLVAGDTVFFRVVSRDVAGNLAWTGEQSLSVPPRFSEVVVAQTGADSFTVSAQFEGGAVNPELLFGMQAANNSVAFAPRGGGLYTATLNGVSNIQELVYQIRWQDGNSQTFTSNETPFEATGGHVGISTTLGETSVMDGGETLYIVNAEVRVPSGLAADLLVAVGDFEQIGGSGNQGGSSVEGVDSTLGYHTYSLALGEGDLLEAGDYTITLRGLTDDGDIVLDRFQVSVGGGTALSGVERGLSWTAPEVGDDQVAVIDGVRVNAERSEGRSLVDAGPGIGSFDYSVFYGNANADSHNTTVTSTEITETDSTTTPPTVTVLGYELSISTTLTAAESANIAGDLQLAWRAADSGTEFANQVALSAAGNTTLDLLAAGQYDLKLFYTDTDGNEVIVDWLRADTATASDVISGRSVTVLARETDAVLSLNADDVFNLDPGLFTGPVSAAGQLQPLSLNVNPTGNDGGAQSVDGRDTGYFTENRFDALDNRIATNEETGVWREFGVDGNGNTIATYSYGEQGAAAPVVTYAAFDARNRNVARFAAPTAVDGESGARRAVTRFGFDVFDNVVSETDARGGVRIFTYNALGSRLSATDQLNNTTTFAYDRLGNQTRETDALGNNRYQFYDDVGRLIREEDGKGDATNYAYDVFDRRLTVTNALGQSVQAEYDQRDRQIEATDALGNVSRYQYDGRDNRAVTYDANGNRFEQVWDALGRVVDTVSVQNGQTIHERNQYDAYGNLIAETDGEGRGRSSINGAFGRVAQEVDEGGRQTFFEYDRFGNVISETSPASGKNIQRSYDAANRLIEVDDLGTGVKTTYSYDIAGQRKSEVTTTPGNAHNRDVRYEYDALGQMIRWADGVTGMQLNYLWDAAGNLFRAFTDAGYDPENENLGSTPFIDHDYSYDANNRVTLITQRGALERQFGYDAAGNRVTFNDAGQLTSYSYDANGRVVTASTNGKTVASWAYDKVGNILNFKTFDDSGSQTSSKTQQYYENNRNYFTRDVGDDGKAQETTLTLDRSGRVTQTVLNDDGKTFYFRHNYFSDGRESSITATGKASGSSTSSYDKNDNLIRVDKGRGDSQESNEFLTFVYNNDGQILYRFHEQGQDDETPTNTEYAYANGNPVGETGNDKDNAPQTELDSGTYSLVKNIGEDFPDSAVTFVTVGAGDSLQGIASRVYGNPSLWFVIADANGLRGGDALKEGTRLQIPNTVKTGALTADAHAVYNEGDIVGSTLPNLKSPPPKKKGCGGILAIIIVVVIAVVAVIVTAGLATAFLGGAAAAASAGLGAQIAAFAVAGAIVGAAASIVQQGLFIALGYQDKFSWKSVAAGAVSGLFSGAAQGVAFAANVGSIAAQSIKYAKTAASALKVASVASKQLIENGKITSWTSLATAALGPTNSGISIVDGAATQTLTLQALTLPGFVSSNVLDYVSPWLGLAETAIRNDGKLTAGDWASAIGSTLNTALAPSGQSLDDGTIFSGLNAIQRRAITNLAVGGALSLFDKDAGIDYLSNAVGNEVGQFIGQQIIARTGLRELATINLGESTKPEQGRPVAVAPGEGELSAPTAASADEDPTQPGDAGNTPLLAATQDADGDQIQDLRSILQVGSGDSFWKIAKDQLGPGATNEEIQRQSQILMELNPSIDPRNLRIGQDLTIVPPFSGIDVGSETLARYQSSDSEFQEFLISQAELLATDIAVTQTAQSVSQLVEDESLIGVSDEAFLELAERQLLAERRSEIDALNTTSIDALKEDRNAVIVISQEDINGLRTRIDEGGARNGTFSGSLILQGEGNVEVGGQLLSLARSLGIPITEITKLRTSGRVALPNDVPALTGENANILLEQLEAALVFDLPEGIQNRLVFIPEGVSPEAAKRSIFFDTGRRADDLAVASVLAAVDQIVDQGGGQFVDTTVVFNQSTFNTVQARLDATTTDEFKQQSFDRITNVFDSEFTIDDVAVLSSPLSALAQAFGASEVDRLNQARIFAFDELAPAGLREGGQNELILEGALLGLGFVGKIAQGAKAAFQAAKGVSRGLRSGRIALRSPIVLNRAALSPSRVNGNPIDIFRLQNPLVSKVQLSEIRALRDLGFSRAARRNILANSSIVDDALAGLRARNPNGPSIVVPGTRNVLSGDALPRRLFNSDGTLIPLGFRSADDFGAFTGNLNQGLRTAGFDDVVPVFQGSSVTGFKQFDTVANGRVTNPAGTIFDTGLKPSDFDIGLASPQLLDRARSLGIPLRGRGTRSVPLNDNALDQLGLLNLRNTLQRQASRSEVNFVIFNSVDTAVTKTSSIIVR